MRPIAVLSEERVAGFDDVPTAKEQGIDSVSMNWRGVYVPKDISDEEYAAWVDKLRQVGESEQWQTVMAENGLESYALFGDEFEAFVNQSIADVQDISREIGLVQ